MPDDLSPESRKSIDAFVRKIADQHELGEDVHEELVGHVEDRVLGLLVEDESLSERKALDQVQAHFGDAVELKELLRGVHADASTLSFARHVLTIAIASLCIYSGLSVFIHLGTFGIIYGLPNEMHTRAHGWLMLLCYAPILVIILWWQTHRWRKSLSSGQAHWVSTMPIKKLGYLFIFMGLVFWLLPGPGGFPGFQHHVREDIAERLMMMRIAMISNACMCLVWMRWCDTSPYSFRRVAAGGVAWFAYLLGVGLSPPGALLQFPSSGADASLIPGGWEMFTRTLPGTDYSAIWFYPLPFEWRMVSVLIGFGSFYIVYALVALAFYVVVIRRFPLRPRM